MVFLHICNKMFLFLGVVFQICVLIQAKRLPFFFFITSFHSALGNF
ncbi:hypothetical protein THF5H11_11299 [Vibrio jasicida]|nr:hypothetical protein THF5H11_11299 [Vibrio jasicida]